MTARPVNPAKPGGRSGAPPSAMVAKVALVLEESPVPSSDDEQRALAMKCIAAMFDNLPRGVMARALDSDAWDCVELQPPDGLHFPEGHNRRVRSLQLVDAAITAARAEVLGIASVARALRER